MAYGTIKEVTSDIAEREYGIARTIKTTAVTSCMIIVCPVGTKLLGIHLSIFGETDIFGPADADRVQEILRQHGADLSKVHIFGELDFWGGEIAGYDRLMEVLGHPGTHRQHQRSGTLTITAADLT
ncbi:uncharacterized protein CMC5_026860 [Chondromyces crocatus]|uniref:Uncharacterized protein n=2 Tax=Chondromyces crocatus TaxID=52 RepID=A0A0K1ECF6_CHOCO|nr:uncharacterized protein CMC5_026860 [Chondromyces crocatus]